MPVITIPANIEDTEKAFVDYAKPIIKEKIQEELEGTITITSLKKDTLKENQYVLTFSENGEIVDLGDIHIILKKTNDSTDTKEIIKTDTTTNIKLETTNNVVPENTQLVVKKVTTGNTYSIVEKAINNEVSKFVLYDITLKSNNTTIQPNGKVKISIPVPNGYDTSKIVVYRIAEDGTKTKYDTTINNGYVTFETDHFSNYVVAEETITNNDTTKEPTETQKQPDNKPTTSGKLDDTPKTGADNTMSVICSIVSVLSIIGIAIIKKF